MVTGVIKGNIDRFVIGGGVFEEFPWLRVLNSLRSDVYPVAGVEEED